MSSTVMVRLTEVFSGGEPLSVAVIVSLYTACLSRSVVVNTVI